MAQGWFKFHRELTEHWLWEEEPFTKAQAWVDLIAHANYKPNKIVIKGKVIPLSIGQQARSEVTLSKTWKWSRNKVRRFLNLLKTEQMVEQETIQQTSIITICNYSEYQQTDNGHGTGDGTTDETGGETGAKNDEVVKPKSSLTFQKHPKNETGSETGDEQGKALKNIEKNGDNLFCETGDETGGETGTGQGRDRCRNTVKESKKLRSEELKNNTSASPKRVVEIEFEKLWLAFPKDLGSKGSKKSAFAEFKKIKLNPELINTMITAVTDQAERKRQMRAAGEFAENFQHVERWIRNSRWSDELPVVFNQPKSNVRSIRDL